MPVGLEPLPVHASSTPQLLLLLIGSVDRLVVRSTRIVAISSTLAISPTLVTFTLAGSRTRRDEIQRTWQDSQGLALRR